MMNVPAESTAPAAPPAPPPQPPALQQGVTIAQHLARITPYAWVTPALVGLIVIGFVVELCLGVPPMGPTGAQLLAAGGDFGPSVVDGEWWRIVSSMFLHAGLLHIAFNLWAFWNMGRFAERVFGNAAFLAIYLLSGIGGSLASLAVHPLSVGVGASGAIFGVYGSMLAFVVLHKGVFPGEFLARQRNSLLGFIAYNVVFSLSQQNVDLAAHAGGLATGILAGALMSRDLLRPGAHALRRAGAAAVIGCVLVVTGWGVGRRILAVPEVQAWRAASEGFAHFKASEFTQAIVSYTKALEFERDGQWLYNRGLAYLRTDQFLLADKDLTDAASLDTKVAPQAMDVLCELRLNEEKEHRDSAITTCTQAIGLDPKNARLLSLRAAAHADLEQPDAALADASAALAVDPEDQLGLRIRVITMLAREQGKDVEPDCAKLLAKPAPSGQDLRLCALVADERGDHEAQRARLDRAILLNPADNAALVARGRLNEHQGLLAESLADAAAATAAAPDDGTAWNNKAWVEVLRGDFEAAKADADRAVALANDDASSLGTRCFAQVGLGQLRAARVDCARAATLRTVDGATDRGMLAFIDGRYGDARREWEAANRDPNTAGELTPWLARLPRP